MDDFFHQLDRCIKLQGMFEILTDSAETELQIYKHFDNCFAKRFNGTY